MEMEGPLDPPLSCKRSVTRSAISVKATDRLSPASIIGLPVSPPMRMSGSRGTSPEKRDVHRFRCPLASALTEYIDALRSPRNQHVAHILDNAEHVHSHLLEHEHGLSSIFERHLGRRSHNNRARYRSSLNQRQLYVTVPGGRSITRYSRSFQFTPRRNCCTTLLSIGPRQISGLSPGFRKPMDMS